MSQLQMAGLGSPGNPKGADGRPLKDEVALSQRALEEGLEGCYPFINIAVISAGVARIGVSGLVVLVRSIPSAGTIASWTRAMFQAYWFALRDFRAWKTVGESIGARSWDPVFKMAHHEVRSLWYAKESTAAAVNSGELSVFKSVLQGQWRPFNALSETALKTNPTPIASVAVQGATVGAGTVVADRTYKILKE